MDTQEKETNNIIQNLKTYLKNQIEREKGTIFAVVDAAQTENILIKVYEMLEIEKDYYCLYRGQKEKELAQVAPYLIKLDLDSDFADWLLTEGWGNSWAIFAIAPGELEDLRKHFRKFLLVKTEEGKELYFRYYDPRIIRAFLPTCNWQETNVLFGDLRCYLIESDNPETLLKFTKTSVANTHQPVSLLEVEPRQSRYSRYS